MSLYYENIMYPLAYVHRVLNNQGRDTTPPAICMKKKMEKIVENRFFELLGK